MLLYAKYCTMLPAVSVIMLSVGMLEVVAPKTRSKLLVGFLAQKNITNNGDIE